MPAQPLTIRDDQLRLLRSARTGRFLDRLADHVSGVFPAQAARLRSAEGRALLASSIARARAYGLADEHSIVLFTDLCFGLGDRFEIEQPWIKEILTCDLGSAARMYLIYKQLPERCPEPVRARQGSEAGASARGA